MADSKWNESSQTGVKGTVLGFCVRLRTLIVAFLHMQDYGNEVRGCHTKEDIHDEEVIIEVPLKCLITVEMGKETEV